jgi:hypothetical protein
MTVSPLTVIQSGFLEVNEVPLGCLVPNPANPGMDFYPVKPPAFTLEQISKRSIEGVREWLDKAKHSGFCAKLKRLFSAERTSEVTSTAELIASVATLYYIKHTKIHLKDLCKDDDAKDWIQDTLKFEPIFLVIGFLTVTRAEVEHERKRPSTFKAEVKVPTIDILTHGVASVTTSDAVPGALDIGVGLEAGGHTHAAYAFVAPGERIIGVQYRKLRFKLLSSKVEAGTRLDAIQWEMFLGDMKHRGGESRGTASGDILETDFEEELTLTDLELDTEVYDATVEDTEFVFVNEEGE